MTDCWLVGVVVFANLGMEVEGGGGGEEGRCGLGWNIIPILYLYFNFLVRDNNNNNTSYTIHNTNTQ